MLKICKICMPMIMILLIYIMFVRNQHMVSFIDLMVIYLERINFVCVIVLCETAHMLSLKG
jgi:hypothetical protein